jgi:hypothetical protein
MSTPCSREREEGPRLRTRLWLAMLLLGLLAGCAEKPGAARRRLPTVPATVLTVRVNIPGDRASLYLVAMHDQKVRIGSEADRWRLFDLRTRSITFVDDVARTFRTRTMNEVVRERNALMARDLPAGVPVAKIEPIDGAKTFAGIPASGFRITVGGYERELWISQRVIFSPEFLTMYLASESISTPFAAVMRDVQRRLGTMRGFPVHDRSEMPYGDGRMVIERTVTRQEQRNVPAVWFEIPADYRDLTPASPSPGGDRRPVSSTPRDRTAPAGE